MSVNNEFSDQILLLKFYLMSINNEFKDQILFLNIQENTLLLISSTIKFCVYIYIVIQGLVQAVGVSNYGPKQLLKIHGYLKDRGVPLCSAQVVF